MAVALQRQVRRAVLTALKGDAALAAMVPPASIYPQAAPIDPPWPFIKLGVSGTQPKRSSCLRGGNVTTDIHLFTHSFSSGGIVIESAEDRAAEIGGAVEHVLSATRLALENGGEARITLSDIRLMQDNTPDAFHWFAQINARVLAA